MCGRYTCSAKSRANWIALLISHHHIPATGNEDYDSAHFLSLSLLLEESDIGQAIKFSDINSSKPAAASDFRSRTLFLFFHPRSLCLSWSPRQRQRGSSKQYVVICLKIPLLNDVLLLSVARRPLGFRPLSSFRSFVRPVIPTRALSRDPLRVASAGPDGTVFSPCTQHGKTASAAVPTHMWDIDTYSLWHE